MFSRKPKEPAGPAPVQEAPPTGDYAGSSPAVANLGEFNPNVNDHAHVQKGPRKHHSIAMATHMVPKEDKWSHHTKETVADLKHLTEEEPDEEMGTLAMIGYKMKLYSSMTKLQADIAWYNYMIKLKKRQFGIEVYKVLQEDGRVGPNTLDQHKDCVAEVAKLEEKVRWAQAESLKLSLKGEGETVVKPRSPRAKSPRAGDSANFPTTPKK